MNDQSPTGGLVSSDHNPGDATPEKVAKESFKPPKLVNEDGFDFLQKLCSKLEKEDETTDRLFHQKWIKVSKFYEGEHLGRFDSRGQWRSYQPQMGDPYFIHPEMRFHSDAITSAWTQSRPDIRILPASDDDRTVAAARKANQLLDHYEETLLDEEFLQREGKLGQFTGQMYRYTWWDPLAGPKTPRYDFDTQEIPLSGGMSECPHCGLVLGLNEVEGLENCPQCGSPAQEMVQTPPQFLTLQSPKEVGKFPIGDVRTECVPAFQVKVDRSHGTFKQTSFLRRRRMLRPEILKSLFPLWNPPISSSNPNDYSLRAEKILQQSTGQGGGFWRSDSLNSNSSTIVNQWWLDPCWYASRPPEPQDLTFASGEKIPQGISLIEVFPTGLYLLIVDSKILDMREENLHEHWQHTPFISIPTRVEGDGIEDLLEPAREFDDLMSLIYTDAKANAAPPTIVNTTFGLKTSDISGKPHWVVPARVPTGERIDNAIWRQQSSGAQYSLFKFIDMLREEQQLLAKSFSPATGAPAQITDGQGTNTATGAQLATSAAQQQRGPELAMRAYGTLIWARQVLKLFQKNASDSHYIPLQGRYGLIEGNYFKGSDVDADFIFSIRNRSWIPRDEYSRRSDLLGAIQAGLFNPQLPRAVREEIAEIFNVSITITSDVADTRIARMRLEQMKSLLKQMEEQAPPEILSLLILESVPLELVSDNHQTMSEWYIDWLKTDDGLMASPSLRQIVVQRIQQHEQAVALQMQRQQALMIQAQAPQIAMQQSQQDQQIQREQENKVEDQKHEKEMVSSKSHSKKD